MASGDDFVSGCVVKRAAKRMHNAGGCDTEDDYSKGYDDAIMIAIDILLEETGYCIEEILDYEEDEEGVTDAV